MVHTNPDSPEDGLDEDAVAVVALVVVVLALGELEADVNPGRELLVLLLAVFSLSDFSRNAIEPGLELVGSQARTLFCQLAPTCNPHSGSRA